jgi:hypothetical protein
VNNYGLNTASTPVRARVNVLNTIAQASGFDVHVFAQCFDTLILSTSLITRSGNVALDSTVMCLSSESVVSCQFSVVGTKAPHRVSMIDNRGCRVVSADGQNVQAQATCTTVSSNTGSSAFTYSTNNCNTATSCSRLCSGGRPLAAGYGWTGAPSTPAPAVNSALRSALAATSTSTAQVTFGTSTTLTVLAVCY